MIRKRRAGPPFRCSPQAAASRSPPAQRLPRTELGRLLKAVPRFWRGGQLCQLPYSSDFLPLDSSAACDGVLAKTVVVACAVLGAAGVCECGLARAPAR